MVAAAAAVAGVLSSGVSSVSASVFGLRRFSLPSVCRRRVSAVRPAGSDRLRVRAAAGQAAMLDTASGLDKLHFDNTFVRNLPADPVEENHVRQVLGAAYSKVEPTPVKAPKLLSYSPSCAALLDLSPEDITSDAFAQVFAGNKLVPGMEPFAACYGGHQFGSWAGQLGDGRAISLGEAINQRGERWELQLKGAGRTPYSRQVTADGRAVVRSSVREYLVSEAMHALGVPTTRALSLVATGEGVLRDQFYDGNLQVEPGAVVCRVAPSFLRFGNFELFYSRKDVDNLTKLADYAIQHHFPELADLPVPKRYGEWYRVVVESTAKLIAKWQAVGFVHGVMNTDNLSILGLTIDYGPYGYLDAYDEDFVANTSDYTKRYCYVNQPTIAMWNCVRFGNALTPLVDREALQTTVNNFQSTFSTAFYEEFRQKLGLQTWVGNEDPQMLEELLNYMQTDSADFTNFFRSLSRVPASDTTGDKGVAIAEATAPSLQDNAERKESWRSWMIKYSTRLLRENRSDSERAEAMNKVNPKFILRNHLAHVAIEAIEANGDTTELETLKKILSRPYDEQPEVDAKYTQPAPKWAQRKGICQLSCSS
eukprot:jgi/Chlat1/8398/Chrsp80S07833